MTELALVLAFGLLGLGVAAYLARWVLAFPPEEPRRVPRSALRPSSPSRLSPVDRDAVNAATLVRSAAESFSAKQSTTTLALSAVLGGAIFLAYGLHRSVGDGIVSTLELGVWLTISFALGAAGAVASARIAVWVASRTGVRVATGVRRSTDLAVRIALRGGAVSGLFITAIGILGQAALFAVVFAYKGGFGRDPGAALRLAPRIPLMTAGFALGASFAALLGQIGAGTFAKVADIAADLGGREMGLDEDDARNPAFIADLAGDLVGGAAGRGAAIFESTVGENLGAMLAGALLYRDNGKLTSVLAVMLFPLVTRAFGVVAAVFGVMVVRTDDREDPRSALTRGLYVTTVLHAVGFAGAAKWLLEGHWLRFLGCGALGSASAIALLHLAHYYTEHRYRPVREIAEASRGGPTLAVLLGMSAGLEATVASLLMLATVLGLSFHLGAGTGLVHGGLYGSAVTTMALLGPAAFILATDAFGPIVDNAAGIVEITVARDRPDVRGRTMVLDAVGNTVKTLTSSWAAASACLASLLLVGGFLDEVQRRSLVPTTPVTPAVTAPVLPSLPARLVADGRPEVLIGATIGVALVLWLVLHCIGGVARPARRVMDEIRRQLKDRTNVAPITSANPVLPSPADHGARSSGSPSESALSQTRFVPDHEAVMEVISRAALRHVLLPAVVAAGAPIAVGLALRFARPEDNPLAIADSIAALVMAGSMAGILGAFLLGNAGGAWDNAKKYIATGAHGGRHLVDESGARGDNPTYTAALVGDTVGDPLKDLAGPAMHILVKLLPVVTIVFLPFFL